MEFYVDFMKKSKEEQLADFRTFSQSLNLPEANPDVSQVRDPLNNILPVSTNQPLSTGWCQTLLMMLKNKGEEVDQLKTKLAVQEETIAHLTNTVSTQANTLLDLQISNLRLQEHLVTDNMKEVVNMSSQKLDRYKSLPTNKLVVQQASNTSPVRKAKFDKEKAWISHMVEVTNRLTKKYAVPAHRRAYVGVTRKRSRPSIVPKVFGSIWRLLLAPPPPTYHHKDVRPVVNLTKVNFSLKRNLPKPASFPVFGPSLDPAAYTAIEYRNNWGDLVTKDPPFLTGSHLQKLPGLRTDHGILAMPVEPVHGFVWDEDLHDWVIAAWRSYGRKR